MATTFGLLQARIDPKRIAFIKFILEGYDNLTQLSTIDRVSGEIVFRFHPGQRNILLPLLDELQVEYSTRTTENDEQSKKLL